MKRGIKVWVRADATNGYVCEFQVYTGKHGNEIEHGLGHRVVSDLVRSLHGKKYHIFCDHFFPSVKLAEDLLENDLYLCGTTRSNRKDFPKQLKPNVAARRIALSTKRRRCCDRVEGQKIGFLHKHTMPGWGKRDRFSKAKGRVNYPSPNCSCGATLQQIHGRS